jgi:hypothetical protein
MRKVILVALILAVLTGGIGIYATYQRQYILSQAAQTEMVGLTQSLGVLDAVNTLSSNGVYIAFNRSMFDKLSAGMTGQSVSLYAKQLDEEIYLAINAASVRPEAGRMKFYLDLSATSPKRSLTAGLEVDGLSSSAALPRRPTHPVMGRSTPLTSDFSRCRSFPDCNTPF